MSTGVRTTTAAACAALCATLVACESARDTGVPSDPRADAGVLLDGGTSDAATSDAGAAGGSPLAVLNPHEPERAARGAELLGEGWPGAPVLPKVALQNLWLVWGI